MFMYYDENYIILKNNRSDITYYSRYIGHNLYCTYYSNFFMMTEMFKEYK